VFLVYIIIETIRVSYSTIQLVQRYTVIPRADASSTALLQQY